MSFKGKRSKSGIVLIAVVAFIVIVSVMVLGIMSRNASQTISIEEQVRHMQAEQLRKGAMWVAKAHIDENGTLPANMPVDLGPGKDFLIRFSNGASAGVSIDVDY